MRTFTPASWGKMLLAGIAVLVVGGPGFVLADPNPNNDYVIPRSARLLGLSTVTNGSTHPYTLQVFFLDGSSSIFGNPPAVFTKSPPPPPLAVGNGFFTTNQFTATSPGYVILKGTYTNAFGTVEGTRRVQIQ